MEASVDELIEAVGKTLGMNESQNQRSDCRTSPGTLRRQKSRTDARIDEANVERSGNPLETSVYCRIHDSVNMDTKTTATPAEAFDASFTAFW